MGVEDDIVINGKKVRKLDKRISDEESNGQGSEGEDSDEGANRVDQMADEIDHFYQQKKEYQMDKDRRVAKKEKKKNALLEQ